MKQERLIQREVWEGMVGMEVRVAQGGAQPALLVVLVEWVAPVAREVLDMVEVSQDRTPVLFEMLIILLRPLRSRAERRVMVVMEVMRERLGMSLEVRGQLRAPEALEAPEARHISGVLQETIRGSSII